MSRIMVRAKQHGYDCEVYVDGVHATNVSRIEVVLDANKQTTAALTYNAKDVYPQQKNLVLGGDISLATEMKLEVDDGFLSVVP